MSKVARKAPQLHECKVLMYPFV